jgi:hypothetical protein
MEKTVSEILDDGTLVFEDGGKIVLSGIRWWTLFGGDNSTFATPKELLEKYTNQGPVQVYLEPIPKDRYGRMHAMVVSSDGTFVQQDLLQGGMAMFWPNSQDNEILREGENQARLGKLGRWGWGEPVVKCHNWSGFWNEGMAIVKGRVREVREFDGATYMNFGEVWWQDFTIMVDKTFLKNNQWQASDYEGQVVEVRGWLYWQGGPQIALENKAQITPLNEGGLSGLADCPSLTEAS